jgi:hypothetical protein
MPSVGFESTIPASERAVTVHALDRSATVTGEFLFTYYNFCKVKYEPAWAPPRPVACCRGPFFPSPLYGPDGR